MASKRYGNLFDMLLNNSIPEPNSGCWLWLRGVSGGKNKYGVCWWDGRMRQATHLALLSGSSSSGASNSTGATDCIE